MSETDATSVVPQTTGASALHPDDLRTTAALSRAALLTLQGQDWNSLAHGLEWTCWRTLQHMTGAVDWYAMLLAKPSPEPCFLRSLPQPEYSDRYPLPPVLDMLERKASVLAAVATAADPSTRSFHSFGYADVAAYVAMGCTEMLLHPDDVVRAFGQTVEPPAELCRRVTARLFPWAPTDTAPWPTLRWATGRDSLPGHPDTPIDWAWHAAPLAEWDGTVKTRASYSL